MTIDTINQNHANLGKNPDLDIHLNLDKDLDVDQARFPYLDADKDVIK